MLAVLEKEEAQCGKPESVIESAMNDKEPSGRGEDARPALIKRLAYKIVSTLGKSNPDKTSGAEQAPARDEEFVLDREDCGIKVLRRTVERKYELHIRDLALELQHGVDFVIVSAPPKKHQDTTRHTLVTLKSSHESDDAAAYLHYQHLTTQMQGSYMTPSNAMRTTRQMDEAFRKVSSKSSGSTVNLPAGSHIIFGQIIDEADRGTAADQPSSEVVQQTEHLLALFRSYNV